MTMPSNRYGPIGRKLDRLVDSLTGVATEVRETAKQLCQPDQPLRWLPDAAMEGLFDRDAQFAQRFKDVQPVAEPLTAHLSDYVDFAGKSLFLEAGSMPAWLAVAISEQAKNGQCEGETFAEIITNSKAAADVLCPYGPVWITQGWLDTKYYGFFPFNRERPRGDELDADELACRKLLAFLRSRVGHLILDASRFSFLLGPTVNSWPNLCYKAVAYNIAKPIDVVLVANKVITKLGTPDDTDPDNERDTLYWHLANCYTVFNVPNWGRTSLGDVLPNPTAVERQGSWPTHFPGLVATDQLAETWLDLISVNRNVRVWIGGTSPQDSERICEHLGALNKCLDALGRNFIWNIQKKLNREGFWILVVTPENRSN